MEYACAQHCFFETIKTFNCLAFADKAKVHVGPEFIHYNYRA
jgi:hypothetical protein